MDSTIWPSIGDVGTALIADETQRAAVRDQFKEQSTRLFCEKQEDMLVEAVILSSNGVKTAEFETEKAFEAHFERSNEPSDDEKECPTNVLREESQFFFLNPSYGWGLLSITQQAMTLLLSRIGVFAAFFKYLSAFGTKSFPQDEGFTGFDSRISTNENGEVICLESCYLLKYVDRKETPSKGSNPWSIRQALIYQKVLPKAKKDNYIFIRLSDLMGSHFSRLLRPTEEDIVAPLHWTQIQMLCFQSIVESWRQFINWIDQEVSVLFDRLIIASVEPDKLEDFDSASSSLRDMKRIQYLLDQGLRTAHLLDINMDVMEELLQMSHRSRELDGNENAFLYYDFQTSIREVKTEHKFLRKNVQSLVARATVLSGQLRDTVTFRNGELNKKIGSLTSRGTSAMVHMSQKSSHEAQVVKILTVVALIFVPTSYAADFMQMGYVSVTETSPFTVVATADLWFYAILAIPLVLLTVAIYFLSELRSRRAVKKQEHWEATVAHSIV